MENSNIVEILVLVGILVLIVAMRIGIGMLVFRAAEKAKKQGIASLYTNYLTGGVIVSLAGLLFIVIGITGLGFGLVIVGGLTALFLWRSISTPIKEDEREQKVVTDSPKDMAR